MAKMLERRIGAVEALPADRRDLAGESLLAIAGMGSARYGLSPGQVEDLKRSIAQADRGEFASDAEIAEMWRSFER